MDLQTTGMEFASEIVINAARAGLRVYEVPITYHPRAGESKLNSFRDGWRHLRFMLLQAPRYLFVLPGLAFFLVGMIGQLVMLFTDISIGSHRFDIHFSALFALLAILGFQVFTLGLFADAYGRSRGLTSNRRTLLPWVERWFSLERGLIMGGLVFLIGFLIDLTVLICWVSNDLGPLNERGPRCSR